MVVQIKIDEKAKGILDELAKKYNKSVREIATEIISNAGKISLDEVFLGSPPSSEEIPKCIFSPELVSCIILKRDPSLTLKELYKYCKICPPLIQAHAVAKRLSLKHILREDDKLSEEVMRKLDRIKEDDETYTELIDRLIDYYLDGQEDWKKQKEAYERKKLQWEYYEKRVCHICHTEFSSPEAKARHVCTGG